MERSPRMVTGVDNGLGPKTVHKIYFMQKKQIGGDPRKGPPSLLSHPCVVFDCYIFIFGLLGLIVGLLGFASVCLYLLGLASICVGLFRRCGCWLSLGSVWFGL